MGDGVFAVVDAALIHNLLHLERDKHSKALRGEGTHGINFADADGQDGIQPICLLILQNCKLAHMLSCRGEDGFGVEVKLFLGVGGNDHGDYG